MLLPSSLVGTLPVGAAAYRPAGACGRRPWLSLVAAAPLFKAAGALPPHPHKLFVKSLTKTFNFVLPPRGGQGLESILQGRVQGGVQPVVRLVLGHVLRDGFLGRVQVDHGLAGLLHRGVQARSHAS